MNALKYNNECKEENKNVTRSTLSANLSVSVLLKFTKEMCGLRFVVLCNVSTLLNLKPPKSPKASHKTL